ncbi:MAG: hypothetical protein AAF600_16680 [Bacteroidota bacterium]
MNLDRIILTGFLVMAISSALAGIEKNRNTGKKKKQNKTKNFIEIKKEFNMGIDSLVNNLLSDNQVKNVEKYFSKYNSKIKTLGLKTRHRRLLKANYQEIIVSYKSNILFKEKSLGFKNYSPQAFRDNLTNLYTYYDSLLDSVYNLISTLENNNINSGPLGRTAQTLRNSITLDKINIAIGLQRDILNKIDDFNDKLSEAKIKNEAEYKLLKSQLTGLVDFTQQRKITFESFFGVVQKVKKELDLYSLK